MKSFAALTIVVIFCCASVSHAQQAPAPVNFLAKNSGFELSTDGLQPVDWEPIWSRQPGSATGSVDPTTFHTGSHSYRVTSTGTLDWCFANSNQLTVPPDSLVTIGAWVKCDSLADAEIGVAERSADDQPINWMAGRVDCGETHDWKFVRSTFSPSAPTRTIQFRLTGSGAGTIWIDDVLLSVSLASDLVMPGMNPVRLTGSWLTVTVDPAQGGAMTVAMASPRRVWQQAPAGSVIVTKEQRVNGSTVKLELFNRNDGQSYTSLVRVDLKSPKIDVTITGNPENELDSDVEYPPPFETAPGDALVIPTNEGLLYPVDDPAARSTEYQLFQGHGGLCMAWFGQEALSDGSGVLTIVATPDDATLLMHRPNDGTGSLLNNQISWDGSKGKWAYDRRVQYLFFSSGGYVAQAKAYRAYATTIGLVKTLAQKRAVNPNIDKLIGAADIWDWDSSHAALQAQEFKDAGMDRVLWAAAESADTIDKINALGYLSSRYDVYQDEYAPSSPASEPKGDDWPNDLLIDSNGNNKVSWIDYRTGPDGKKTAYDADVCCSIPGLARAERAIPAELSGKHYTCRFIDTITASPWRECYSPLHPTTRTIDKETKMKLLNFVSSTEHLVTGSETGIDSAVPYDDYFEGMMSLAHYRLADSGYKVGVYQTPTPDFLKFQIGVGYRIPLFELVYHDCMVDTWYWGDASNQEPEVWSQRDLWNVLYGTSPIYVLDANRWASQKDRLIQSYKAVSAADRAVGYAQMVSHVFLTPDHMVQQTIWSNGTVITVNFGDTAFAGSRTVGPLSYDIEQQSENRTH